MARSWGQLEKRHIACSKGAGCEGGSFVGTVLRLKKSPSYQAQIQMHAQTESWKNPLANDSAGHLGKPS